jgi:hypothetical protein
LITTPLTDLGSATYLGFGGGLYPNGENSRPITYEKDGVALAATVQPINKNGKPSARGKIVMLCIGMSNASREFSEFTRLADADPGKNRRLLMVDAAQEGASARKIALSAGDYWTNVNRQLQSRKVSAAQVQVVWLKAAIAHLPPGFPEGARRLKRVLRSILEILRKKFPQLKLVYVSSRTYGGYSESNLSPEPMAYESGFAVKWLIEDLINDSSRDQSIPWVSWGPYLWGNGLMPRSDGLVFEPADFEPDGVHPSEQGAMKVATKLFEFFTTDPTAQHWFLSRPRKQRKALATAGVAVRT